MWNNSVKGKYHQQRNGPIHVIQNNRIKRTCTWILKTDFHRVTPSIPWQFQSVDQTLFHIRFHIIVRNEIWAGQLNNFYSLWRVSNRLISSAILLKAVLYRQGETQNRNPQKYLLGLVIKKRLQKYKEAYYYAYLLILYTSRLIKTYLYFYSNSIHVFYSFNPQNDITYVYRERAYSPIIFGDWYHRAAITRPRHIVKCQYLNTLITGTPCKRTALCRHLDSKIVLQNAISDRSSVNKLINSK